MLFFTSRFMCQIFSCHTFYKEIMISRWRNVICEGIEAGTGSKAAIRLCGCSGGWKEGMYIKCCLSVMNGTRWSLGWRLWAGDESPGAISKLMLTALHKSSRKLTITSVAVKLPSTLFVCLNCQGKESLLWEQIGIQLRTAGNIIGALLQY